MQNLLNIGGREPTEEELEALAIRLSLEEANNNENKIEEEGKGDEKSEKKEDNSKKE